MASDERTAPQPPSPDQDPVLKNFRCIVGKKTFRISVLRHVGDSGRHRVKQDLYYWQCCAVRSPSTKQVWCGWATEEEAREKTTQALVEMNVLPPGKEPTFLLTNASQASKGSGKTAIPRPKSKRAKRKVKAMDGDSAAADLYEKRAKQFHAMFASPHGQSFLDNMPYAAAEAGARHAPLTVRIDHPLRGSGPVPIGSLVALGAGASPISSDPNGSAPRQSSAMGASTSRAVAAPRTSGAVAATDGFVHPQFLGALPLHTFSPMEDSARAPAASSAAHSAMPHRGTGDTSASYTPGSAFMPYHAVRQPSPQSMHRSSPVPAGLNAASAVQIASLNTPSLHSGALGPMSLSRSASPAEYRASPSRISPLLFAHAVPPGLDSAGNSPLQRPGSADGHLRWPPSPTMLDPQFYQAR